MLYDFHTHTYLSDGVLSPIELIRLGIVNGYTALGITDHASVSTAERVVSEVKRDAELARRHWNIEVFAGVEITHVPAESMNEVAEASLAAGAEIIVVHGETVVEPVEPGTNRAAITCGKVDVLAHPGMITLEELKLAAENDVFIEITCRKGHSLTNGRVVRLGREAGVNFLVNSDSHAPGDLPNPDFVRTVACGAGLTDEEADQVLYENPKLLIERLRRRAAR